MILALWSSWLSGDVSVATRKRSRMTIKLLWPVDNNTNVACITVALKWLLIAPIGLHTFGQENSARS